MKRSITAMLAVGGVLCASYAMAQAPAKESGKDAGVAAYINGQPVTIAELDQQIAKTNAKAAQQIYDARKAAVDEVILQRAFAKEAEEKKVPVDKLVQEKIAAKVTPVTDADVQGYYDANKSRMQGRPLEQVGGQIRQMLAGQRETESKNTLLDQARKDANVKMVLDPPRVEVAIAENDPSKGPANAKVTIVEFSEFQ